MTSKVAALFSKHRSSRELHKIFNQILGILRGDKKLEDAIIKDAVSWFIDGRDCAAAIEAESIPVKKLLYFFKDGRDLGRPRLDSTGSGSWIDYFIRYGSKGRKVGELADKFGKIWSAGSYGIKEEDFWIGVFELNNALTQTYFTKIFVGGDGELYGDGTHSVIEDRYEEIKDNCGYVPQYGRNEDDMGQYMSASSTKVAVLHLAKDSKAQEYVKEKAEELKGKGYDDSKAFAVAWSIYCKYKSKDIPDSEGHCTQSPNSYFPNKKAARHMKKALSGKEVILKKPPYKWHVEPFMATVSLENAEDEVVGTVVWIEQYPEDGMPHYWEVGSEWSGQRVIRGGDKLPSLEKGMFHLINHFGIQPREVRGWNSSLAKKFEKKIMRYGSSKKAVSDRFFQKKAK